MVSANSNWLPETGWAESGAAPVVQNMAQATDVHLHQQTRPLRIIP
jgi:hypothetical protein